MQLRTFRPIKIQLQHKKPKANGTSWKREKQSRRENCCYPGPGPHSPHFCMGSGHEGLILAKRMPQRQKNLEFWIIRARLQDVRGKNNPGDLLVWSPELTDGSTAMQKGSGKRPKMQTVDSPMGQFLVPFQCSSVLFFFFNYINLSQRKFHETLWCTLPKKCLKNPWPITFRD